MTAPTLPDDLEQKARALLDTRVTAVRQLASTRQTVIDARTALEQAERADAAAYAAAEKSGWSPEELRKLGLDAPARRTPGRPRGRSNRTQTGQQDGAPAADSPSGPAGQEPAA